MMLYESDNSDEEPDFTSAGLTKGCNEATVAEAKECVGLPRKYDPEDLLSVETDRLCKDDWFLAGYWPVYVGNFKVEQWVEDTWYEQISNYFAYNGLLTRMIYIHHQENDKEFASYQRHCMLIDMLVYFTSQADAERAIATCHRDSYYGYRLNVLPGRYPVFFSNERSVMLTNLGHLSKYTPVETVMENAMSKHGPVTFAGRYANDRVVLEFVSTQAMLAGIASQFRWKPAPIIRQFRKQRFLERDVKMDIVRAKESNPAFMDMQPKASVLAQLYEGVRPSVSTQWKGHKAYVKTPAFENQRKTNKQRMRMLFKRNKSKKAKPVKAPTEAEIIEQAKAKMMAQDPAPGTSEKTKRQREADNMKSINWFLRMHGAGPISRAKVKETQMKVQKQMQGK